MKTKTPKQWAEEWVYNNHANDFGTMIDPISGVEAAILAAAEYWGKQAFEAAQEGGVSCGTYCLGGSFDPDYSYEEWWESVNKEES